MNLSGPTLAWDRESQKRRCAANHFNSTTQMQFLFMVISLRIATSFVLLIA